MAAPGGLGGLGGYTYPVRLGAPDSRVVGYVPDAQGWGADWSSRFMDESAKPYQPSFGSVVYQQVKDYGKDTGVTSDSKLLDAYNFARNAYSDPNGAFLSGNAEGTTIPNNPTNRDVASEMFGPDFYSTLGAYRIGAPGYRTPGLLGDLKDEKSRMVPLLEGRTRAQQAYAAMLGNGQVNGLMSEDYSKPGFGSINGDFGQANLGTSSFGAGSPLTSAGATPSTIWGAAPQRARPWSL